MYYLKHVLWLYLACSCIGTVENFGFLIENGQTTFTSSLQIQEFELSIETKFTMVQLERLQKNIAVLVPLFLEAAIFTPTTGTITATGLKTIVNRALTHIVNIMEIGTSILKYSGSKISTTSTATCKQVITGIDGTYIENLADYLKNEGSRVQKAWTLTDFSSDTGKTAMVIGVVHSIEAELTELLYQMKLQLSIIDSVFSFEYPSFLYGSYHNVACLGIIKNENIIVKQCHPYSTEIRCTMEVWYAEFTQTLPLYVPVVYNNVRLAGPLNENIFVKSPLGSHYQVLNCQKGTGHSNKQELCTLGRLEQECEKSLIVNDVSGIIEHCRFIKDQNTHVSTRLADKSILVEDRLAKVKITNELGHNLVSTSAPYQIHSPHTVTVETDGLKISYPGNGKLTETKVINSSLPEEVLEKLISKMYYAGYWEMLHNISLLDLALLVLQFGTIAFIGLATHFYRKMRQNTDRLRRINRMQKGQLLKQRSRTFPLQEL